MRSIPSASASFFLLLLIAAGLGSCRPSSNKLLHAYSPVKSEQGWRNTDTIRFEVPSVEHSGAYSLSLGLRARTTFPWEGVWMAAELRVDTPAVVHRDTLHFRFIDREGKALARGVNLLQAEQTMPDTVTLRTGQSGTLSIYHLMRRECVPDITDVGARLELAK